MQDKSMVCPACDNKTSTISKRNYHGYNLFVCGSCGCEFCDPFKAPATDFYTNADDVASSFRHTKLRPWGNIHPTNHSPLFNGNNKGKTLLDIGCGNGAFVEFADNKGYSCVGIDLDANSLKAAQQRKYSATTFSLSTLKDYMSNNPGKQFDVVSMFEVFEHLDNPKETITLIRKILKPGGYFIGTLPNENRFFAKSYNLNFALPPYHLTYWRKDTWTKYLDSFNGMNVKLAKNNVYYGYLSSLSLHKVMQRLHIENNNFLNMPFKLFFRTISVIEQLIEKSCDKSSSFYFEVENRAK